MNYTWFEQLLQADKEITSREGKVDIVFRRDVMDFTIEVSLLSRYWHFVEKRAATVMIGKSKISGETCGGNSKKIQMTYRMSNM